MLDYLRIMLNARVAKMDERGASAVEYGLLIAGIAALIVVVVFAFGDNLQGRLRGHLQQGRRRRRRHRLLISTSARRGVAAIAAAPRPSFSDRLGR